MQNRRSSFSHWKLRVLSLLLPQALYFQTIVKNLRLMFVINRSFKPHLFILESVWFFVRIRIIKWKAAEANHLVMAAVFVVENWQGHAHTTRHGIYKRTPRKLKIIWTFWREMLKNDSSEYLILWINSRSSISFLILQATSTNSIQLWRTLLQGLVSF